MCASWAAGWRGGACRDSIGPSILNQFVAPQLWIFVNCLVENATFDSQTKENMTLRKGAFGSECNLSDKVFPAGPR
jgi:hypothetical protein